MPALNTAALELLKQRNSAPRLVSPAPSESELEQMWQAALRAPDNARLTPWRFMVIAGEARQRRGGLFVGAGRRRDPDATAAQLERVRGHALRAPLLQPVGARL